MTYAAYTKVPAEQTRAEIERTLTKHGASRFAFFMEPDRATIVFDARDRRMRFDLPLVAGDNAKAQRHRRERWRALLLCIKAKLESVESGIESFEEAFLAHVVMPDGKTVAEHALPAIAANYKGGMTPLLPAPAKTV